MPTGWRLNSEFRTEKVARAAGESEALVISRASAASSSKCLGIRPIIQSIRAGAYKRLYVTRAVNSSTTSTDLIFSYEEARGEAFSAFPSRCQKLIPGASAIPGPLWDRSKKCARRKIGPASVFAARRVCNRGFGGGAMRAKRAIPK